MMIGKVYNINPMQLQGKTKMNAMDRVKPAYDSVDISDEARQASEAYFLNQVAKETPDVREDLVASIKEKIKDPNYLNPERIALTADRVMAAYGL
jgi:negative regulator of flagellin synthesis FlgM